MKRDQYRLLLGVACCGLPPVGQLGAHGAGWVVGDGDATALVCEEDICVDVALAQPGERADLLGVELAAVAGQVHGAEAFADGAKGAAGLDLRRSEEHTSELQSLRHLVCRLLLEKKKRQ